MENLFPDLTQLPEFIRSIAALLVSVGVVLAAANFAIARARRRHVWRALGAVWRGIAKLGKEARECLQMPQPYPRWRLAFDVASSIVSYIGAIMLAILAFIIAIASAIKGQMPLVVWAKVYALFGVTVLLTMASIAEAERSRLHAHVVLGELRALKRPKRRARRKTE